MSIASEPGSPRIYTEEAPRRHAPVSETGVIGWVRHNLFHTPLDIALTILASIVIYAIVASAVKWAVADANWFAITRNLSLFMLGPLQADPGAVDNIQIMTLILVFAVGLSFAAWAHIGMRTWIVIAAVAVVMLIVPPVIASTLTLPPAILSVGSTGVISGSVTETPAAEFAFIGDEGETITISFADEEATDDLAMTGVAAFTDRATDALVNASRNRISSLTRLDQVNARLEDPNLSNAERAQLVPELESLTTATETSVTDRYALNASSVTVRILSGDLETVLLTETLAAGSEPVSVALPASGWYVLEKTSQGEGVSLIEVDGVYPLLERQFSQPVRDASGNIILGTSGQPRTQTVTQYARIVDDFAMERVAPPRRDGTDIPRFLVIDNQYRGERPLSDFLVLHVGPFLDRLNRALIPCLIAAFLGYLAGHAINRYVAPIAVRLTSAGYADRLLATTQQSNSGLGRFVARYSQVILGIILVVVVMAVVLSNSSLPPDHTTADAMQLIFNALLVASVAGMVVVAFLRMLRPAHGVPYASRVVSALWFIMPFIIFFLVAGTDVGRWGGLFLTFMLTVVGIVASFPIGVLLALGRRADGLPVIKYLCITFIEVVRGVPLITVLFLASLALPLVSPALSTVPGAVRAMVAITLFSAAYLAENVRGGLQSIPPGQAEAARALGMNPVQVTAFITLPQALRAVIPALVGQCIALFKDTSLVAIVGLLDLTKTADSVVAQAEYIGLRREAYIFISIVYFVFSYFMAYISRKLEQSGSGRARQTKL